jgi:hypothetical protein
MIITRSKPKPPLGPYPQFRLWGHVGTAPSSNRTRITINMVGMVFLSMRGNLFAQHFGYDEDEDRPAKTSPEKEIDKRISHRSQHGLY